MFIDVTVWGKSAENSSQYLKKGSAALVEGRLKLDSWEKDGQKRSKLKVVANKVQFLGGKPERVQAAIDDGPPFDADEEALTF